jgi:hypothetical protein
MMMTLAWWCVELAFVGAVLGTAEAGRTIMSHAGRVLNGPFLWSLVPLLSVFGLSFTITRRSLAAVWVPIGTYVGFVIVAAFSLGPFFFWPSALLLAAGGLHGASVRERRRLAAIPVWLTLGASGLGAVFYGVHELQARLSGGRNIEAPVIIYSTGLFLVLCTALSVGLVLTKLRETRKLHSTDLNGRAPD